jgi:hypothetical protein
VIESLRATWQAITWRRLMILQALGQLAIYLESREQHLFGTWMGHPSAGYVSMALSVFLLVPIALLSDEAVKRGAKPKIAYPIAVTLTVPVAIVATALTQHVYLSVFGLPPGTPNLFWQSSIEASVHMYIYGAFGMLVFMNQRTADRMLENFRNSELRRAQLERQLVESRLATAEAQIDPTMLFEQLAEIRLGFKSGGERAEVQLTELIQTLRTALTRTVSAHESVAGPAS